MEQNYFEKVHRNKITSIRDVQRTLFDISKTYQKWITKRPRFFVFQKSKYACGSCIAFPSKLHQKNTSKQLGFFVHRNCVE